METIRGGGTRRGIKKMTPYMDRFLPHDNELGRLINEKAAELYARMKNIDPDKLGLPEHCLHYFKVSHSRRLFFSIETSAHLLYRAIRMKAKPVDQLVIMDYGAGVGTLYLLAAMLGCRHVIYNDHLHDWRNSAESIALATKVKIDHYVVGDITECLEALNELALQCDIIASRNVIEHIYRLDKFYAAIHRQQPNTLVYSSTTANMSNPASVVKHLAWHRKWEKIFRQKRLGIIRSYGKVAPDKVMSLARATRGLATEDLSASIKAYEASGILPDASMHRSNTCDPENGVWAEHMLTADEYGNLINRQHFEVIFAPGFWDTHYGNEYKNRAAKWLNKIIARFPRVGMKLAPFIYVAAKPLHEPK